jgi:hypothetical protein
MATICLSGSPRPIWIEPDDTESQYQTNATLIVEAVNVLASLLEERERLQGFVELYRMALEDAAAGDSRALGARFLSERPLIKAEREYALLLVDDPEAQATVVSGAAEIREAR